MGGDGDDSVPTPSTRFFSASALDLDYVVASSLAAASPDHDSEPDCPEVAAIIKDIFTLHPTPSPLISPSLAPPSAEVGGVTITATTTAEGDAETSPASPPTTPPPPSSSTSTSPPAPSSSSSGGPAPGQPAEKPLRLANIAKKLEDAMKEAAERDTAATDADADAPAGAASSSSSAKDGCMGRLGPKKVTFDPNSKVGNVILDSDHLGVTSQSNFSTLRANSCVFQGVWWMLLLFVCFQSNFSTLRANSCVVVFVAVCF